MSNTEPEPFDTLDEAVDRVVEVMGDTETYWKK